MSKYLIVLILVVIAGAGIYSYKNTKTDIPESSMELIESSSPVAAPSIPRYLPYTSEVMESSSLTRRVLFFYASWCPTCRPADADFSVNQSRIPEDVMLIRVNYSDDNTSDDERELASKYNITYQHTFVQIDSEGNVVTQWNGGKTVELVKNIK